MPLIEVHNVSVILDGRTILSDLSFDIERGAHVAIIGPNGAGKSVLIKTLLGLFTPTRGHITFHEIDGERPRIGYVPQHFNFDRTFPLTIAEFLSMEGGVSPFSFARVNTRAEEVLRLMEGEELLTRPLGLLSGGQMQRVFLAGALMHHPHILILDEPSSGIDAASEEKIYMALEKLTTEEGTTILMASHDLHVVASFATDVLCVNEKLLCHGPPLTVLTEENLKAAYGTHVAPYRHHTHM